MREEFDDLQSTLGDRFDGLDRKFHDLDKKVDRNADRVAWILRLGAAILAGLVAAGLKTFTS